MLIDFLRAIGRHARFRGVARITHGLILSATVFVQPALSAPAEKTARTIPQKPSARIIIDNDFAGDPDGLTALVHQLLSPKTTTTLLVSSSLNPEFGGEAVRGSAEKGRQLALELLKRMPDSLTVTAVAGAEPAGMGADASEAARAIVAEANREAMLPLYYTCGGPLTNLAAALALDPSIAQRMTLVWIGGGAYPEGGWEYNMATDAVAARKVIEQSDIPVWIVPQNAYRQMQYSIAEMTAEMRPISPLTRWIYDQFTTPPDFVELGGTWPLGDQPLVLLTALSTESSRYTDWTARKIGNDFRYGAEIPGRSIRVYEQLDARLTFGDFIAQLKLSAQ